MKYNSVTGHGRLEFVMHENICDHFGIYVHEKIIRQNILAVPHKTFAIVPSFYVSWNSLNNV